MIRENEKPITKAEIESFRKLLDKAKGYDTTNSFLDRSHVNVLFIERYLQGNSYMRPSEEALRRIAVNSKGLVTYNELIEACGYNNTKEDNQNEMKNNFINTNNDNLRTLTQNEIKRGQIYLVDFGSTSNGSIQGNRRPALLICNDICAKYSPVVTVVPITSKMSKKKLPTHVLVDSSFGLLSDSLILCEQIISINKTDLIHHICDCPSDVMQKVDEALKVQINLVETPDYDIIDGMVESINNLEDSLEEIEQVGSNNLIKRFLNEKMKYVDRLQEYCDKFNLNFDEIINSKRDGISYAENTNRSRQYGNGYNNRQVAFA